MTERHERFDIDLHASPSQVWTQLTTAEGLAAWFGTRAEIDLRVGGQRVVGWGEEMGYAATITDMEPNHRLRLVYLADGEQTGAEEWLIVAHGDIVRLTLIHSMRDDDVDDWEGFYGDIRRGWRLFLASLRFGLEDAATPTRTVVCRYVAAPLTPEEVSDRLDDALDGSPLLAGMTAHLLMPPHSRLLVAPDRTLLLDVEGSGDDRVLYAQAATHDGATDGATDWADGVLDLASAAIEAAR